MRFFDKITHTVSATLIAGLGYASFRALELHTDEIEVPKAFRAAFIVVFVLAAAILWEVIEFALGGYVPVYGVDDIVTDMVANVAGSGTGFVVQDGEVACFLTVMATLKPSWGDLKARSTKKGYVSSDDDERAVKDVSAPASSRIFRAGVVCSVRFYQWVTST